MNTLTVLRAIEATPTINEEWFKENCRSAGGRSTLQWFTNTLRKRGTVQRGKQLQKAHLVMAEYHKQQAAAIRN